MNLYKILLRNKEDNQKKEKLVEKMTFPEAAMAANLIRIDLGFHWEITSIAKQGERNG